MMFLIKENTTLFKRLFLITTALFLFACSSDNTVENDLNSIPTKSSEARGTEPVTTAEEVLSKNQIKELKQDVPTLASAIAFYKNEGLIDVDPNDDNPPQLLMNLLLWDGIVGMTWEDLNSIPETNYDMIKKDVIAEAGKRFCFEGTVHEIQVDRSIKPPVTNALMYVPFRGFAYVVAVRSSGDILPDVEAKVCGIVTGNKSYQTFAGMNSAPYLLGMFDLPENK